MYENAENDPIYRDGYKTKTNKKKPCPVVQSPFLVTLQNRFGYARLYAALLQVPLLSVFIPISSADQMWGSASLHSPVSFNC